MTKSAPEMVEPAPPVGLTSTQEIIRNLKTVKEQQHLSIAKIIEMVHADGCNVSPTTLRRVFADGFENDSFNYEITIKPIAQALLIDYGLASDNALRRARTETYEAILKYKSEIIDNLRQQLNAINEANEKRCQELEKRIQFLLGQIDLKDQRMDRKDEIIKKLLCKALDIKDE